MSRGDEERALRRLNFSDLKFLQDFFRVLPGSPSLSEAARQLDISREENLHHRLRRVLRNLDDHPPVNDGTKTRARGKSSRWCFTRSGGWQGHSSRRRRGGGFRRGGLEGSFDWQCPR